MGNSTLKATLIATAISLSLLAPAQAQAPRPASATAALGQAIAEQGNAALRTIRAEIQAAAKLIRPTLPAKPKKVAAPASSLPATAAAAE